MTYSKANDISDRKGAEEVSREREAFLNLLLDAIPVPVFSRDKQGRLIGFNRAFGTLFEATGERLIGKTVFELHPPELAEIYHATDTELFERGGNLQYETRIKNMRGELREVLVNKAVFTDEQGAVIGLIGTILDITETRRAENEVRRSNELLRAIIEATPVAIMDLDLDGNVKTVWNPAAEKMLGWSAREVLGHPLPSVPEEKQEEFQGFREKIRQGLTLDGVEVRRRKRDGDPIDYSIYASPLHDARGRIVGNVAVLVDITEHKRKDEALDKLNRELRALNSCNQTLLRAVDEQTLLNEICRIIRDEAGYRLAWVGYAENDSAKTVRPVAWSGFESEYIANAQISWADDNERGRGPAGIAIRSGETICVQDISADPRMAPWRESALRRGYRSGLALPLKDEEARVFGVLLVYHEETNVITPDEIRLMEQLSGDLAYGIISLRTRAERKRAEDALNKQYTTLRNIIDSVNAPIFSLDRQYRYTSFNEAHAAVMKALYGAEIEMGRSLLGYMTVTEDRETAKRNLDHTLSGERLVEEAYSGEEAGSRQYFQVSHSPIKTGDEVIGVAVIAQNLTERKQAEEKIKQQLDELMRWHEITLDREDRVQDLKREVNQMCARLGEASRYPSVEG
ncbi:MAG: PAS domain S-box protein [Thermodesulfobacteriota bacterium]